MNNGRNPFAYRSLALAVGAAVALSGSINASAQLEEVIVTARKTE